LARQHHQDAAAEIVTRRLVDAAPAMEVAILDLRRVRGVQAPVGPLLRDLAVQLAETGGALVLAAADSPSLVGEAPTGPAVAGESSPFIEFAELDLALEWAEDRLLAEIRPVTEVEVVELVDHEMLAGVEDHERAFLVDLLEPRHNDAGETIFQRGEEADEMLLVRQGQASVSVLDSRGRHRRVATLGAGALLGEMALINAEPRGADVVADTEVDGHVLTVTAIEQLLPLRPEVRAKLLGNVLRIVSRRADKMRDELAHLID
jgi:CRP-like cAMP-binding protein